MLGTCASCHNGSIANGKPGNHIPSGNTCDDCHSTNAWLPAVFDHVNVSPGTCTSCHNGATAEGKPGNHIITNSQCDECHSTIAWTPANFNHDAVTGSCSTCHNGSTATGKPSNHFVTSQQCDTCHSTFGWLPINFSHSSPNYPGDHRGNPPCTACHLGNSETANWTAPSYKPDCAGCHANDFKPGPHKQYETPDHKYTVGELRDCTGACHVYTDSTLTTIKKSRPGPEHRVTRGGF